MITLIHGTDVYLSARYLQQKRKELEEKGYEIQIVNVDESTEIPDQTTLFAIFSQQDLFGGPKALVLKRIASCDLFYKLGRALKTSERFFEELKNCQQEIILWEDKKISKENPLSKVSKEQKEFIAPTKDWEISAYIQKLFPKLGNDVRKIILTDIKTTDTFEIATEIERLMTTPNEYIKPETITLQKEFPAWIISDALYTYVVNPNEQNLNKLLNNIESIDEDIRFKLAIIQNAIGDFFWAKKSLNDEQIRNAFFPAKRNFVFTKLKGLINKVDFKFLYELYKKSIIVEYYLNKGLIEENFALADIFAEDFTVMNSELLSS